MQKKLYISITAQISIFKFPAQNICLHVILDTDIELDFVYFFVVYKQKNSCLLLLSTSGKYSIFEVISLVRTFVFRKV